MTARTTDPATSHLAATYIAGKRPGLKDAFLMALKALGPSTANEIAQWCVQSGITANAESVRKRALELVRDGLCEWSEARACTVTKLQARTVRVADENQDRNGREDSEANRRSSTSHSGQPSRNSGLSDSGQVRNNAADSLRDSQKVSVRTPEAERVAAVVEHMKHEREAIFIPELANELSRLAKLGTWPEGDSNQYIAAIDKAVAEGLIERTSSKVRRVLVAVEKKPVQKDLFD